MQPSNLLVSAFGVLALIIAATWSWRWRWLPIVTADPPATKRVGDSIRTLAAALAAGLIAGAIVLGVIGRLVMRLAAALSEDVAQGRLTDAGEEVGQITAGGTIAFVVFIGLGGGIITAAAHLVLRRWLPQRAWAAGLVAATLLAGTIGIADPIDPANRDFAILDRIGLTLVLLLATAVLFGLTFMALAARFEATIHRSGPRRWMPAASLIVLAVPPVAFASFVYVAIRSLVPTAVLGWFESDSTIRVGRALIIAATVTCALLVVRATGSILG